MSSRLKEDEKNERIIRGLLKLSENKRCINCNSMGPQYVCTTFWTFVCTNCSGIHREFTHRVKSVSMSKFTSQEVSALQGGGNQRARDIYFKGLDPQRLPDGSNVERLRDFIRHVYVNKKYADERIDDKSSKGTMGEKDNHYENKSPAGSRSPQYEDTYDRRSDRSSPGGRSPGYESKYGDYGKSPSRAEVVNDWHRDDRFRNRVGSEEECNSPEQGKDQGSSSPPVVRPVREILRDSVVPLRISEPPRTSVTKVAEGSAVTKQTVPPIPPRNEKPREVKLETAVSLIDFDADPEPLADPTTVTEAQQSTNILQPVTQPIANTANDNWANFDIAPSTNVSQAPPSVHTLDSLLSELSVPATAPPVQTSGQPSGPSTSTEETSFLANPSVATAGNNNTGSPYGMGNYAAPVSSFSSVPAHGQWPDVQQQQQQPSLFPTHFSQSTTQNFAPPLGGNSGNQSFPAQPWNTTLSSTVHRSLSAPALQPLHPASNPVHEVTSGGMQPSSEEQKSTGRKELPQDLFSGTYPYYQGQAHGWQTMPPRFNVQYNAAAVPFQSFQQSPPQSSNPFDFNNDPPAQIQTFPSLAPLQGALPNMQPPLSLLRTSSLDSLSPAGMTSQTIPHPYGAPYQASGHHPSAMPLPPRYMSPQIPGNMSHSHLGSYNNMALPFGSQTTDQQLPGPFSAPPNPHSFPSGGNPFG